MRIKKIVAASAAALLTLTPVSVLTSVPAGAFSSMSSSGADPLPNPKPDPEPEPTLDMIPDQGDRIWSGRSGCTIGFVDKVKRELMTAAHCGVDGDPVYGDFGGSRGEIIGYFNDEGHPGDGVNVKIPDGLDWATIKVSDGIELGENSYSGDNLDWDGAEIGEEVKYYGSTTQKVHTGEIVDVNTWRNFYSHSNGMDSRGGDSGGPVWTDEGLVGLNTGRRGGDLCNNQDLICETGVFTSYPRYY